MPVLGRKSESNDRPASKLESKILDERTSLMRLLTWSWSKMMIKTQHTTMNNLIIHTGITTRHN